KAVEKFNFLHSHALKVNVYENISVIDIPTLNLREGSYSITNLVIKSGVTESKSEAQRLAKQGAVRIGNDVFTDPRRLIEFRGGEIVKIGKKNFFRIKII
ncbi:MAG: hypothetical protein Q7K44_00330, partial [Candidatus Liptonbacteria bacterium]|nr:hypothetical protein [Candidatus Liptonbacteria bacterium]